MPYDTTEELRTLASESGRDPLDTVYTIEGLMYVEGAKERYKQKGDTTYCNLLAGDILDAMGCYVPKRKDSNDWVLADTFYKWLGSKKAANEGYHELSNVEEGMKYANAGFPVIIICPSGGEYTSSHEAIIMPSHSIDTAFAQAGTFVPGKGSFYMFGAMSTRFVDNPEVKTYCNSMRRTY